MPIGEPWAAGRGAVATHEHKEMVPWAPWQQPLEHVSTYGAHFKAWPINRAIAQRPKEERPASAARFDTRSTMQDSYQAHVSKQQPSCRPKSAYAPTDWMQPISTTHRDAYQQWSVPKRQPFTPKRTTHTDDGNSFTGRSTAQDSYQPHAGYVGA